MLALQAHVPSLRPPECDVSNPESNCKDVHGYNAALLYIAIYLVALGEGCIRANLASFGGDQFDEDDPNESKHRSSFFNWFTVGISIGAITGLIFIVWIEDHRGWDYGFTACALIVILGMLVLIAGSPFYRNQRPKGSPLTRMLQVKSYISHISIVLSLLKMMIAGIFPHISGFCSCFQKSKACFA